MPAVHRVSPLDFDHADMLVADAYEAAQTFLASLQVDGPGPYGPSAEAPPPNGPPWCADDQSRAFAWTDLDVVADALLLAMEDKRADLGVGIAWVAGMNVGHFRCERVDVLVVASLGPLEHESTRCRSGRCWTGWPTAPRRQPVSGR